jgi:hypothetical protein
MHQCWHDQRPYDEDTPWRVTSNEMNSSTESEGSHCKPSLASVAVPPCSARARASSYCLKARVLPTPGSARAHAWQRPSKTPQRPQPALQRYPILGQPLTKDPSQGSDEESFSCVSFGYKYAESQNPNPGRSLRQAGPTSKRFREFSRKKLKSSGCPSSWWSSAVDTARHGIVHRCRRWIDLCTPRPQR